MARRLLVPLHLLFVVASSLCAQDSPISLCVVETKLHPGIQYDASAGPLTIDMYKQLSGRKLSDGSAFKITGLPVSDQKDILAEIGRLQCSWVLQLWRTSRGPMSYQSPDVPYYDVYFSLWRGATRKAILKGSAQFPNTRYSTKQDSKAANAAAEVADQVLNRLNKSSREPKPSAGRAFKRSRAPRQAFSRLQLSS